MASNIVAYAGINNFDNIMYLSNILSKLGKKVLLVDHSVNHALLYSIPLPKGICCHKNIITYRQIDVTSKVIDQNIAADYDNVFISYGFMEPSDDIRLCNQFILVTNLYRFNYERRISSLYTTFISDFEKRSILIKDVVDLNITPIILAEHINLNIPMENISSLYFDEKDYVNGLVCHHNSNFQMKYISKQHRIYLLDELGKLYPEITKKQIRAACRHARKGV